MYNISENVLNFSDIKNMCTFTEKRKVCTLKNTGRLISKKNIHIDIMVFWHFPD